jgi:hypothetical protein
MTEAQRKKGEEDWRAAHAPAPQAAAPEAESFSAPRGYSDTADHLANFYHAVHTRKHVVEDEVFGHHAAIGCHMANYSYFHRTIATWDEESKQIVG